MEVIKHDSFPDMLENKYGLKLTAVQKENLFEVCSRNPQALGKCIRVAPTLSAFYNEIQCERVIDVSKLHTKIIIDDVVFIMSPVHIGQDFNVNLSYPKHYEYRMSNESFTSTPVEQNMAIIRTMSILGDKSGTKTNTEYTVVIYNKNLHTASGIIFEDLTEEEVNVNGDEN